MEKAIICIAIIYAIDTFNNIFGIEYTFKQIMMLIKKPKFQIDYTYYQNGKQYQIFNIYVKFFKYEYGICDVTSTGKQNSSQRFFSTEDFVLKEHEIPGVTNLEKVLK